MTSRQAGRRISELSVRRQAQSRSSFRTNAGKDQKMTARKKRRLAQMMISAVIFMFLVAAKLLLPGRMSSFNQKLSGVMEQNIDVAEVFSSVGRAFSKEGNVRQAFGDAYQAVFHPQEEGKAVETSGEMNQPEDQTVSDNLQRLRQFAGGSGTCDSWQRETEAEKAETSAKDQNAQTTKATQTKNVSEATATGSDAGTINLSYILYSDDNLPDNVSMEQCILGFDYCTPVCGVISSGFGYREHPIEGEEKFHYGIDLAADTGTEIRCFANGTVTAVGESSSYGKYLTVSHSGGYSTLYAHCSKVVVTSGTKVKEGQKIAEVGETGLATGPHLHFELHEGDLYLNPVYYVQQT